MWRQMGPLLRRLGFDKVFDTDFGADMTIMEEASEFIHRVKNGGVLPMITSCSPAGSSSASITIPTWWTTYSTCKSPRT